jgi:hypothetical protein
MSATLVGSLAPPASEGKGSAATLEPQPIACAWGSPPSSLRGEPKKENEHFFFRNFEDQDTTFLFPDLETPQELCRTLMTLMFYKAADTEEENLKGEVFFSKLRVCTKNLCTGTQGVSLPARLFREGGRSNHSS